MSHQTVIVLDFGGQYNQLIARRVRECGVYCEVKPYTTPLEQIRAMDPIGIIFTGGPNSVYDPKSPQVDPAIFTWGVPILGICYGCQLMAHNLGGRVTEAQDDSAREYGKTETYFDSACKLFKGLPAKGITWMSHGDYMETVSYTNLDVYKRQLLSPSGRQVPHALLTSPPLSIPIIWPKPQSRVLRSTCMC